MAQADKPLVWLHGEVKTPPFSEAARIEAGKKTATTPKAVVDVCKRRLREYDNA